MTRLLQQMLRSLRGDMQSDDGPVRPSDERTVLLTGAAGQVGSAIRPHLASGFRHVRLSDRVPIQPTAPNESFVHADLESESDLLRATEGVDAIVHLGGSAKDGPLPQLLEDYVMGTERLLLAASSQNAQHVVLASTMHVLGLYRRDERIAPESAPRPDSNYAVGKLAAEALGAIHAERTGMRVSCVRIGCFKTHRDESEPGAWIGPDDLAALIRTLIVDARSGFEVVHAVTEHAGDDCGQSELGRTHGFRFRHVGNAYASEMKKLNHWYPNDEVARRYRGGEFASAARSRLPMARKG